MKIYKKIAFATLALVLIVPVASAFQSLTTTPSDSGFQSAGAYILSKDSSNTYDRSTDSLEAISDKLDNLPWSASGSDIYFSSGNVGIGTTAPTTALEVAGTIYSTTGGIKLPDGTVIDEAADMGVSQWTTSGSDVYYTTGSVGVGTTAPSYKLEVKQAEGGNFADYLVKIDNQDTTAGQGHGLRVDAGNGASDYPFVVDDNAGSSLFLVRGDGNVGIGTTGPRNGLEVSKLDSNYITSLRIGGKNQGTTGGGAGSEMTRNQILFSSWRDNFPDTVGAKIVALNLDWNGGGLSQETDLAFFTQGDYQTSADSTTERMRITRDGYVGIGTSAPSTGLHLYDSTSTANRALLKAETTNTGGQNAGLQITGGGTNANWIIGTNRADLAGAVDNLMFYKLSGSEGTKMIIDNSGNVGIGTTAPTTALEVAGTIYSTTGGIKLPDGTVIDEASDMGVSQWTTTGSDVYYSSGNVGIGTTTPTSALHIGELSNDPITPTLSFGDGDTGFYEQIDDTLWFSSTGTARWKTDASYLLSTITNGKPTILNTAASATQPNFVFYDDQNTGLGTAGADILSLIAGGTNVLNVTAGNVGIGTTAPDGTLHIMTSSAGSVTAADNWNNLVVEENGNTGMSLIGSATGWINIGLGDVNDADVGSIQYDNNTNNLYFGTAGTTQRVVVDSSGNVGIGTTAPGSLLEVAGTYHLGQETSSSWGLWSLSETATDQFGVGQYTGGAANHFYLASNQGTNRQAFVAGDNTGTQTAFGFSTSGDSGSTWNPRLTINQSGNVGIGTTSPSSTFQIAGSLATAFATKTADYTVTASDSILAGNATSGDITFTLPTAVGVAGRIYTFKKIDSSSNLVKVAPAGAETIDGGSGWYEMNVQHEYLRVASDGADWIVIGSTADETHSFVCGDPVEYSGESYDTVLIGDQCWFAENLNVGTMVTGSTTMTNNATIEKYCYENNSANCAVQGGLYQWNEAMGYATAEGAQGICPSGWHIPTDSEQHTLDDYLATGTCVATRSGTWDCDPAGTALKSGGSSGFEGYLAGYRGTDGTFYNQGTSAFFWSSTISGSNAWLRTLDSSYSTVHRSTHAQTYGFSVRCLQD